jgi:hypothetical protein
MQSLWSCPRLSVKTRELIKLQAPDSRVEGQFQCTVDDLLAVGFAGPPTDVWPLLQPLRQTADRRALPRQARRDSRLYRAQLEHRASAQP